MNAREQIYNRELSILETWSKRYIDALNDVIKKQEELKDLQDQITDDSTVDTSSSYAVLPNGKKKQIDIENGKTLTKDLPCLLYTSPSPRDGLLSRMPTSA